MKRKRTEFQTVLGDGWVRLPPGAWVTISDDPPPKPGFDELRIWMRNLRGVFLSDVFGLESDLISLELAAEFGANDRALPGYFERDQALREEHSLQQKIARAKVVIRQRRDSGAANRLMQQLAECREVRNLMAHYPCWMEPINDEERHRTVGFKLNIGDRHHIWELEDNDVRRWADVFLHARRELIRLKHEVIGAAPPVFAEGSPAMVGSEFTSGTGTIDVGGTAQVVRL